MLPPGGGTGHHHLHVSSIQGHQNPVSSETDPSVYSGSGIYNIFISFFLFAIVNTGCLSDLPTIYFKIMLLGMGRFLYLGLNLCLLALLTC